MLNGCSILMRGNLGEYPRPHANNQLRMLSLKNLRRAAARAMTRGYICSIWSDGDTHWLFAGGLVLDRAREIGRPVLEVHCFDSERESRSVLAAKLPDGTWCHYAD